MAMAAAQSITETAQYLTFTLDSEQYAVDISKVREVLEFTSVTKVPRTPEFLRGVINLRGSVVPVVDLRAKFGLGQTQKSVDTCVVITEVEGKGEKLVLGALADSVQEVIELEPKAIEPPPKLGTRVDIGFIRGMGKRDERFLIILDLDKVLTEEELREAAEGAPGAEEPVIGTAA
jgi:purine-binding chemotaxis protein CheW